MITGKPSVLSCPAMPRHVACHMLADICASSLIFLIMEQLCELLRRLVLPRHAVRVGLLPDGTHLVLVAEGIPRGAA
eukprot:7150288-Pyramimonas_sp.AAC.1